MSDDEIIALSANIFGATLMVAGIFAICWLIYRIVKFLRIVQEIHGGVSKRPNGQNFPLWSVFDTSGLNDKEKLLRAEALAGLGPVMLVFLSLFFLVILFSSITS